MIGKRKNDNFLNALFKLLIIIPIYLRSVKTCIYQIIKMVFP